jgi:hypothetical protein
MASQGKDAWAKHFKGRGKFKSIIKKDGPIYDQEGKPINRATKGQEITVLESTEYLAQYPVELNGNVVYVPFNSIQKPGGKSVSNIKLKPQHFKFFIKEEWKPQDLGKALIDEIDERKDLPADLKAYLTYLTAYHAKIDGVTAAHVGKFYDNSLPGLAEVNKDYGEILGGLSCVQHGILAPAGIKVSSRAIINFPLRGNEPIVDYYIIDGKEKYSVSAKSGSNTNTLKPADVISLITKDRKNAVKWGTSKQYKAMEMVRDYPTLQFPFLAFNVLTGKKALTPAALKQAEQFKAAVIRKPVENEHLFAELYKQIGVRPSGATTLGEVFYATEAFLVKYLNAHYPATEIFLDATTGLVTYVRFEVSQAAPTGKFSVFVPDPVSAPKKDIKWRSKNSRNRADDKIGLQP